MGLIGEISEDMEPKEKLERLTKHLQPKIEALDYAISDLIESRDLMRTFLAQFIMDYTGERYEDAEGNLWFVNRDGVLNYISVASRLKQNPKWKKRVNKGDS